MQKLIKTNIIIFNILPVIGLSIAILAIVLLLDYPIFLLGFVDIIRRVCVLRKNVHNYNRILEKISQINKILYTNSECFFCKNFIINTRFSIFLVDYSDIEEIYFEKEYYGNARKPNFCMITKDKKVYKIEFLPGFVKAPSNNDYNLMVRIIKDNNPKVKLTGDRIKKYIKSDFFNSSDNK